MAGSIFSGQMISRTGRYKIFPIIGLPLLIVGIGCCCSLGRRGHAALADDADHGC